MRKDERVSLRRILADPDSRRKLMVSTIQATQAREGIMTTGEQAQRAYYVASEGERTAFFWLSQFRPRESEQDLRHDRFVSALALGPRSDQSSEAPSPQSSSAPLRFDVRRADFAVLAASPLVYRQVQILAPLFREHAKLGEACVFRRCRSVIPI